MELIYNIDLKQNKEIKRSNYRKFSRVELGQNTLWGQVLFINSKGGYLSFRADLMQFSYSFYDAVLATSQSQDGATEEVTTMYQTYALTITKKSNHLLVSNYGDPVMFRSKPMINKIKQFKLDLLQDFKLLFPDYKEIQKFDWLEGVMLGTS